MAERRKTSRIISTHDIGVTWDEANAPFVPYKGEIIVYDPDDTHTYSRIKIGDGKTCIKELPFILEKATADFLNIQGDVWCMDGGNITEYVDNN